MGDNYQAILDIKASATEAAALMPKAVACLSEHGLIRKSLSRDVVLGDQGYPAGTACSNLFTPQAGELPFWTMSVSGVEVHGDPWINLFGFTLFEEAICPSCGQAQTDAFLGQVATAVETFVGSARVPDITCSACGEASSLHSWHCTPHPGFVNFSILFWNWPSFDASGWRVNILKLLEDALGRPLISTFGAV